MRIIEISILMILLMLTSLMSFTPITSDEEIDNRIPEEYFEIHKIYKDSIHLFKFNK